MEARLEAADFAQRQRQEVEEERALGLRGQRDHLALRLGTGARVDELQIRGLPAEPGAVVDQLAVDFAGGVVDETHLLGRSIIEEFVDVGVRDLVQDRGPGLGSRLAGDLLEQSAHLFRRLAHPQANQPQ